MSNEIQARGPGVGRTCYFTIHSSSGQIWSTSGSTGAFESFVSGNWPDYAISMTEQGVSNFYAGNFPTAVPAGVYSIDMRQQLGGAAAQTDGGVAAGDYQWGGAAVVPLSNLTTSGQLASFMPVRLSKGIAVSGFYIYLKSAADHVTPLVSGIVSGQVSKNGGVGYSALQSGGMINEVGLGAYSVNFTSGDVNADTIMLIFTATGVSGGNSDPLALSILTQKA